MSVTDQDSPLCPQDALKSAVAKVELLMFETLSSGSGFNMTGQVDARQAAAYHLQSGGQRVRAKLALSGGFALGIPDADSLCIATSCELLHNASLIHDDIQDKDTMRRGQPALWSKFGSNLAICSGDYLLSAAYSVLCTISKPLLLPSMLTLLHERTATAIDGQCADMSMSIDHLEGVEHYLKIAKAKSGALLSLPLELVLLASDRGFAMPLARQACEYFAVSYQIFDDLQDVKMDGEFNLSNTNQPKSLNIIFITMKQMYPGDLASAEMFARDLGLQHLDLCDDIANQMPEGVGALLLDFSAELRRMFKVFAAAECI
jgi:geranylgeranyl pyrophosphate synthase